MPISWFSRDKTFQETKASRKRVRINETQSNGASAWLPGLNWRIGWEIGFGSEIHAIFDKSCVTSFYFAGQEEAAGKWIVVYLLAVSQKRARPVSELPTTE